MHLDPRDRRILRACVFGSTLVEIAESEKVGRAAVKKRLDRINGELPKGYRNRSKRILYPVLLLKYGAVKIEELVRLV